ncbi:AfsR/SARP family transcriptional regulator [Streptomyces sp. Je 1-332]|uniref:AfsR/SARP family transcriptional regulator n=1 Tax=Streptomyces sp. Je 1-332 TaxID=3231270 RepID=UPI00345A297B
MLIGVLGPLVASVGETSIVPSAAKPRQLLALLGANLGRPVGMGEIVEELWDGSPPRGPSQVVQTYVKQLRRSIAVALVPGLGWGAKDILSLAHNGYRLELPGATAEVYEFEERARAGARALAEAEDEAASVLLGEALSLWRGVAFADVRTGPFLRAEALRLEELRIAAQENRITAELRLGHHAGLVSELTALTSRLPFHENLHGQLILALYRSGRTTEALEVFRKLREAYARELGIDPSPRLQRLHRSVLASDPGLESKALNFAAF